jgi:hypothetical protein
MKGPRLVMMPSGGPTSSILTPLRFVSRTRGETITCALPSASFSKITSIQGSAQRGWQ